MAKYFIKSARYGEGEGGIACGPVSGPVVSEVELVTDTGERFFVSLVEAGGCPNFFKTTEAAFDKLIDEDFGDPDFFETASLDSGEYFDIYEDKDEEYFPIYRYLIYLVRSNEVETNNFIEATSGKFLDEIEIPKTDIDEAYDEDLED